MSKPGTRWWLLVGLGVATVSAVFLALLSSAWVIPSIVRDPLSGFVQPGVTVWWFVLAGPFRSAPSSPASIAFAAILNAMLWLSAIWLVVFTVRYFQR